MIAEELRTRTNAGAWREKFSGQFARAKVGDAEAVLLRPLTYMNLSGRSVQKAAAFFGIAPSEILVVHDELDLPWKTIRVKQGGGAAGHNGLRSLIEALGTDAFARVRIGIGRPADGDGERYVLEPFDPIEAAELPEVVARATEAVETAVTRGMPAAMNAFNRREKETPT